MKHKKFKSKIGPEAIIQRNFIAMLRQRGWHVERMIGNQLQKGIPDIYTMHKKHGERWVDLKHPKQYEFTRAQRVKWPEWERHGTGIWIITGWAEEDYDKLFGPPNWRDYWKPKYDEEQAELEADLQGLFDDFDLFGP
ncbi:MAG: hypothetical protein DRH04_05930 [Deltaproteobacteria bacterium]|nr:MAG: hypothetical protein DRH04_05930 [Deltaproteobacteria bacterium]